ncbi:MAG: ankyrin repeat domain-containing protein [Vulcanimicrobiota bacterium]
MPRLIRSYSQGTRETVTDVSEQEAREFFKAIMENDLKTVNQYLVRRPDIVKIRDNDFRTPIHYAIQFKKDGEIAISLIMSGANVNAIDRKKSTPLHLAALYGRTEVMEMLISKKAEVNAYDTDNKSPLDYAKTVGNSKAMNILLRNGAKER